MQRIGRAFVCASEIRNEELAVPQPDGRLNSQSRNRRATATKTAVRLRRLNVESISLSRRNVRSFTIGSSVNTRPIRFVPEIAHLNRLLVRLPVVVVDERTTTMTTNDDATLKPLPVAFGSMDGGRKKK